MFAQACVHSAVSDRIKVLAWSVTSDLFTFDGELLHSASLPSAAVRWQAEAADAAACSDTGAKDVVGVQIITALRRSRHKLVSVQFHGYNQLLADRELRYLQVG